MAKLPKKLEFDLVWKSRETDTIVMNVPSGLKFKFGMWLMKIGGIISGMRFKFSDWNRCPNCNTQNLKKVGHNFRFKSNPTVYYDVMICNECKHVWEREYEN